MRLTINDKNHLLKQAAKNAVKSVHKLNAIRQGAIPGDDEEFIGNIPVKTELECVNQSMRKFHDIAFVEKK